MPNAPIAYNVPRPQVTWPQDVLRSPPGFGTMPTVGLQNRVNVRREYASLSWSILAATPGQTREVSVPAGSDGDFWITNICVAAKQGSTTQPTAGELRIRDAVTGYNFFRPFIPLEFLNIGSIALLGNLDPFMKQFWQEPYCLQRNGGLNVSLVCTDGNTADVYFVADGWKEYSDAST